jgi:hypothetical protein
MSNESQSLAEPKSAPRVQLPCLSLGAVSVHEVYPLPVFKQLTGLGGWALREARRAGLPVAKVGRCSYVRGQDFADYLEKVTASAASRQRNRNPHTGP